MPYIIATSTEMPSCYYQQQDLANVIKDYLTAAGLEFNFDVIDRLFCTSQIRGRHFALPLIPSLEQPTFSAANNAGILAAVDLCEAAVSRLLDQTGLLPQDISLLGSVSVIPTNIVPCLEARLMNRLPFRNSTKRMPMSGVGCAGGAFAIGRMADYLEGHPDEAVILLSCEIVSVAWQGSCQREIADLIRRLPEEPSLQGQLMCAIVNAALFSDGMVAVLMVGDRHPLAASGGYQVLGNRSMLMPDTEDLVGLDLTDTGFRGVLHPGLPSYARKGLRVAVEALLCEHGLETEQIDQWILHPGGPKVMDAMVDEFDLSPFALALSREVLAEVGNASSASVLLVLDRFLAETPPPSGTYALLAAMGPGFCQDVVLLRWTE